jgi:signal transduction histidine kinase
MNEELRPELISSLLGLFAHDLRNPLSALHSNVSFLGSVLGTADNDAREALDDVAASSDALGHITDNLELFALALEGAKVREAQEFALRELLREAEQKSRRFAESYRVGLEVDADSANELRGLANRDMLQRALSNLVRNAIQHAGDSGNVLVRARQQAAELVVSVTDSGAALAPEVREQAFTPEGQLWTKSVSGGRYSRGLGLYAARIAASIAGAQVCCAEAAESCLELRIRAR